MSINLLLKALINSVVFLVSPNKICLNNHVKLTVIETAHHLFSEASCPPSFATFTSTGVFTVPCGVHHVKVLLIGGGGGGGSGAVGGGAAGYLRVGDFEVEPLMNISIIIGKGGIGSTRKIDNCTQVPI